MRFQACATDYFYSLSQSKFPPRLDLVGLSPLRARPDDCFYVSAVREYSHVSHHPPPTLASVSVYHSMNTTPPQPIVSVEPSVNGHSEPQPLTTTDEPTWGDPNASPWGDNENFPTRWGEEGPVCIHMPGL